MFHSHTTLQCTVLLALLSFLTSIILGKLVGFVSYEGKSKWLIQSVPHSAECQKLSSVSLRRPHYPLNFQLFQRQMSTPGIHANLSMMNTGDCAILTSLSGDKWAHDQTFFFLVVVYFIFSHLKKQNKNRLQFMKAFLIIAVIFLLIYIHEKSSMLSALS